jgi:hypothetical protein
MMMMINGSWAGRSRRRKAGYNDREERVNGTSKEKMCESSQSSDKIHS